MSRSGIKRKHAADAIQLRRISRPASPTYKEGTSSRANERATQDAQEDKVEDPPVSLLDEDEPGRCHLGFGRTPGSVELGRHLVQVHFEEE